MPSCLPQATFPNSCPQSQFSAPALSPTPLPLASPLPALVPTPHSPVSPGEKPYVCTVPGCGKRFTEYSSLYKHHVVHTHCKPYTCSSCGKTYRQTSTLAMHKRSAHGELEATEESEQALYEQQQLEGEGGSREREVGPQGLCQRPAAGDSLGFPLLAASAAEESPPPKPTHIAYLSEVKEESSDIPAQVAMVTEEDGAPQVALITQDGTQQVEALGMGGQSHDGP